MKNLLRAASSLLPLLSLFIAAPALADNGPCGRFDFSEGLDCSIEVAGGCELQCDAIRFEAACAGGCTAEATTTCTGPCVDACAESCNPAKLDCMAGCDFECKSRCLDACELDDCSSECQSSCAANCKASCTDTAVDCAGTCSECCHGACTTEVNIGCDVACYAKVEGQCMGHCDAPSGALFCNGQYVAASDVEACIVWLAENYAIETNVEARGKVTCDLNGCDAVSEATAGCSVGPEGSLGSDAGLLAPLGLLGAAAALSASRRRRG